MRNYKAIAAELVEVNNFKPHDAAVAVHMMEIEDASINHMRALENAERLSDDLRSEREIKTSAILGKLIAKRIRIEQLAAYLKIGRQIQIEGQQRKLLADRGHRDRDSIFLASILKYFCGFSDHQIAVIVQLSNAPQVDVDSWKMN